MPRAGRTPAGLLAVLGALALAGCDRPRAPVLTNDPVYQDDREGFRFLAPQGWRQTARFIIPRGKAETERPIVDYRRPPGGPAGSFRVTAIDLPESADLAAYLATPSMAAKEWVRTAPPQDVEVGGAPGVRHHLQGRVGKDEVAREVVCVRRGARVYLFTAFYTPGDTESRDQLRRVVDSIIWKE